MRNARPSRPPMMFGSCFILLVGLLACWLDLFKVKEESFGGF